MNTHRNPAVVGKILVSGLLDNTAPLIISQGSGEDTDSDIVVDGKGRPFIPGTSWVGALRNHLEKLDDKELKDCFFGTGTGSGQAEFQSALVAFDLDLASEPRIEIRTSTRIDPVTRTADEGSLHDYEVLAAGHRFKFRFEVTIRKEFESRFEDILKLTNTIVKLLEDGDLALGAGTNAGFGRVRLGKTHLRVLRFPQDSEWWFTSERSPDQPPAIGPEDVFPLVTGEARITGVFALNGSLMVRQENTDNEDNIDCQQMISSRKPVIPGTSLKGVIRHQAARILQTMLPDRAGALLTDLFGFVETTSGSGEAPARKGRISVAEAVVRGGVQEKQTRIRVDMFTGGALEGALFSELPLWDDGNTIFDLDLRIRAATGFEMALILQVLKDLWTGWLTVGGEAAIGRGRFDGRKLTIIWKKRQASIVAAGDALEIEDPGGLLEEIDAAWRKELETQEDSA